MRNKQAHIRELKECGILWSYDKNRLDSLPDAVYIEHVLRYGDVPNIRMLFEFFSKEEIKEVWLQRIAPDKSFLLANDAEPV